LNTMLAAGVVCAMASTTFQNPYLMNTYFTPQKTRYTITDNSGSCQSDSQGWCQTPAYTVPSTGVYTLSYTQFSEKGDLECSGTMVSVVKDICVTSPCTYCPQNLLTWYCLYPDFWPLWLMISGFGFYLILRTVSAIGWAVYPFISAAANTASKTMFSPLAVVTILCMMPMATAYHIRSLQSVDLPSCPHTDTQYFDRARYPNRAIVVIYRGFHQTNFFDGFPSVATLIPSEYVARPRGTIPFADDGCGVFTRTTIEGIQTNDTLCLMSCSSSPVFGLSIEASPLDYGGHCHHVFNNVSTTRGYVTGIFFRINGPCQFACDEGRVYTTTLPVMININGVPEPNSIFCSVSDIKPTLIEITSSITPSVSNTPTPSQTSTTTFSIGYTFSTTKTATPTVTPTVTPIPTPTHTPYPNLGAPLDTSCGVNGAFDHRNNAVMDLPLLNAPPGGNNYGWYTPKDEASPQRNMILGYTDGTEGCYGVNVDYQSGVSVSHVFCTKIGPSSVNYEILYDASTSDTNNFTDGDEFNMGVSIVAALQPGNVPRGSCEDDGSVICKRQSNWWSDCRTGTIGMHANVDNTVITRSTLLQGFDGGDTSTHCVYITDETMTQTLGSRRLSARLGHPVIAEILVQVSADHPYVQRNIPTHPNSGLKVYMGGCPPDVQYCQDTYPGPRALTDVTDRSWMYDTDGYFGNQSIDRMYGSEYSLTVSESRATADTCGLDPSGTTTPTVMLTMSDAILNNAIPGMLFEPRGKDCGYMLIWGPGCGAWTNVIVDDVCGDYSLWSMLDFSVLGKIPECANLVSNFDRTTYKVTLHPLCVAYFPNREGELITEDFLFDTIRLACTSALNSLETIIANERQGSWTTERANNFVRNGLQYINRLNSIQYYYNVAGNVRRCPGHNIGMALKLAIDDLSVVRDFLATADNNLFNLDKLCGNFLQRDVDGTNKGTVECMAAWRFPYAWSLTWPHIIDRDHANPPHRFNYGKRDNPVTEYICPAGITANGCIPPDSDACELGRSINGYWNQLEWTTVAGVRLNDLLPPVMYGTTTNIVDGLPESTTFAGISNPLILQIGERDDEYRKVTSIRALHDPMMCPMNVRLLEVDGFIGSGGGSYAHVQFNNSWAGVPGVETPMYMAVMGQSECLSVLLAAGVVVGDAGSAIGQEAHSQLDYGDKYTNMFIPFTVATPTQTGVAELLVCPYYVNDIGTRLPCPLTTTIIRLRLPYSVLVIDAIPIVKEVGHVFEERECFAGICSIGWPFGLGFGSIFGILIAIVIIIIIVTALISCFCVPQIPGLPKLHLP